MPDDFFAEDKYCQLRLFLTTASSLTLRSPGLSASRAMDNIHFMNNVISVNTRNIRKRAAFTVPFNANSFDPARAATSLGLSTLNAGTRNILCNTLRNTARRCTALRLLNCTLHGRRNVRFQLTSFLSISIRKRARLLNRILTRFLGVFAFLTSRSTKADNISNSTYNLDQAVGVSATCKHTF